MRILVFLLLFNTAFAYKLVMIKTIAKGKKTFIASIGKKDNIIEGSEGTFTADNLSLVATAVKVTRHYSQWKVNNPELSIPFQRDQIVNYNRPTEHLWAIMPKSMKDSLEKKHLEKNPASLIFRTSLMKGFSSATTGSDEQNPTRGGLQLDALFEKPINRVFSIAGGFRFEQESIESSVATLVSTKYLALAELIMYFPKMDGLYDSQIYTGMGYGIGKSVTSLAGESVSGNIQVLPSVRLGMNMPINENYDFLVEFGFESTSISESTIDGQSSATSGTAGKASIALRKYL